MEKLDKNSIIIMMLTRLIPYVVIIALLGAMLIFNMYHDIFYSSVFADVDDALIQLLVDFLTVVSIVVIVVLLFKLLVEPFLIYKYTRYDFSGNVLLYNYEHIFIRKTELPLCKVQSVELNQSPISRIFKVGKLRINSANGLINTHEIEINKCIELCDRLNEVKND